MLAVKPFRVYPDNASISGGFLNQYVIGNCNNTDGTATKVHVKLNIPKTNTGTGQMMMIEALGFAYGSSQAIRCSWTFYQYNNTLFSVNVQTVYPGLTAEAVYYSSDNFVCLRGAVLGYYSGFILNAYVGNGDQPGFLVAQTAQAWNTNAGAYF
jgi:hypothetical protein